jgi:hypothetical protein
MRNAIFTILILFAGLADVSAQSRKAILKVMLSDGSPLSVSVNGRMYDKHGKTITIADLPGGTHYVKVYEYKAYRDERGGHARLLYSGNIRTRRNTLTILNVSPETGRARVKTVMPEDEFENPYKDRSDYYHENELSQRDMQDLKQRVEDRITDTDKMKLLKSVLANSRYYTDDVKQMMSWMSFESTRLEFAKWAFANVIDSKNYWKLESEFTFSSSKDEFNEYIKGKN